jgi:hypothetical protein
LRQWRFTFIHNTININNFHIVEILLLFISSQQQKQEKQKTKQYELFHFFWPFVVFSIFEFSNRFLKVIQLQIFLPNSVWRKTDI